ncbi:MAG: ABC transporter substrate-binding protein [Candidatus Aminicenantales bacterium]
MLKKTFLFFSSVFCLLLILWLFSFPFSQKPEKGKPRYGGTLRVKSFTDVFRQDLDPASPGSYIFILEHLYEGLVKLDKNLSPTPALADYWVISGDGKEYTFYLRKGAKFHHGPEVTAEDVKFSLERIVSKSSNSPYYQFFTQRVVGAEDFRQGKAEGIQGFRVIDSHTFEIKWKKPYVAALYLLSMPFSKVLPRELVQQRGKRFFSRPSGTGPFKFGYWLRSPQLEVVGVRLEKFEDYYGRKPYVSALEFSPYYTLDHFLQREIDIIPVLSNKVLSGEFQIFQDGSLNQTFLGMSCNISPLDRRRVRQALSYGIDKSGLARAAYSYQYLYEPSNNYIPPKLPGFYPSEDRYGYDPEKAKQILENEGFFSGKKFPPLFLYLGKPRNEIKLRIFRELREELSRLGITLRVRYYNSQNEVKESREPYLVMIKRTTSFPDAENVIRPLFSSSSTFNLCNYSNPEIDRLLEESDSIKSWSKRIKLFHQIENILVSDVPAIPLYTNQQRIVVQPYVHRVEIPLRGFYYLDATQIWLDK